jgi:hypothetical protein
MDAESIAKRLSPAQKRALLWLPGDGSRVDWKSAPKPRPMPVSLWGLLAKHGAPHLAKHGPTVKDWHQWEITPLGLEVRRAILTAQEQSK